MANMLTWLFQLLFLPCTLEIANVRKFLHMLEKAGIDSSLVQEEWDDMIEYG